MSCGRAGVTEKIANDREGGWDPISSRREYFTQGQDSEEWESLQDPEFRWVDRKEETHTECTPQTKHRERSIVSLNSPIVPCNRSHYVPISQMRTLRFREVKNLLQYHQASQG